jgi:hypothetical protein
MTRNSKKKILIIGFVLSGLVTVYELGRLFSPGSYAYAEEYEIKANDSLLIKGIEKFKQRNPAYCVPDEVGITDGQSNDRDDHRYHVYFYFKDDNEILITWIRPIDKETTTFAFVGINDGLVIGNWKDINKDFSTEENNIHKEKFKEKILEPIKRIIIDKK